MDQNAQDISLKCVDCEGEFFFTVNDQEFYASKKYQQPKRCKACRAIKKEQREGRG